MVVRRVPRSIVDRTRRADLVGGEAIEAVAQWTLNRAGVPIAESRVGEEVVGAEAAALQRARGDDALRDEIDLVGREVARRRGVKLLVDPHRVRVNMRAIVRRRAAENAVVVVRKALRFHERLLTAGRTTVEIRIAGALPIEGADDLLRRHRHEVRGAITEIEPLFGMSDERIAIVVRRWGRTHVRRRHRAPRVQGGDHLGHVESDVPRVSAVAGAFEPQVPTRDRHPDFDVDQRIARGRQGCGDAAERSHFLVCASIGSGEARTSDRNRRCDHAILQWNCDQRLARDRHCDIHRRHNAEGDEETREDRDQRERARATTEKTNHEGTDERSHVVPPRHPRSL